MALVTILAIATLILGFRQKAWLLTVVAVLCGIFLMGSDTKLGKSIRDGVTSVSATVDGFFK